MIKNFSMVEGLSEAPIAIDLFSMYAEFFHAAPYSLPCTVKRSDAADYAVHAARDFRARAGLASKLEVTFSGVKDSYLSLWKKNKPDAFTVFAVTFMLNVGETSCVLYLNHDKNGGYCLPFCNEVFATVAADLHSTVFNEFGQIGVDYEPGKFNSLENIQANAWAIRPSAPRSDKIDSIDISSVWHYEHNSAHVTAQLMGAYGKILARRYK